MASLCSGIFTNVQIVMICIFCCDLCSSAWEQGATKYLMEMILTPTSSRITWDLPSTTWVSMGSVSTGPSCRQERQHASFALPALLPTYPPSSHHVPKTIPSVESASNGPFFMLCNPSAVLGAAGYHTCQFPNNCQQSILQPRMQIASCNVQPK